ncbi:hypothetical protein [Metabacillus halosaccharovorans]|uniref:Uncharacterized protein n=1 Tax=Metabacillus halosaccharovorans TaxID=930124 RepID=A0ABT3DCP5_9BACI|nr:hypothetical protein [Metabacillus halosaccharovorans]MCV9884732.1 hypothetical protein [Metabacillus halosaccharovorans]
MDQLAESIKETIDRVDGYITGRLIVDLEKSTVELEQENGGKITYLPLSDLDLIQVRNGDEYVTVYIDQALNDKDQSMNCSLYAGLYGRVKKDFHFVKRECELVPYLKRHTKLTPIQIKEFEKQYNKFVKRKAQSRTDQGIEKSKAILRELDKVMTQLGYEFKKLEDINE